MKYTVRERDDTYTPRGRRARTRNAVRASHPEFISLYDAIELFSISSRENCAVHDHHAHDGRRFSRLVLPIPPAFRYHTEPRLLCIHRVRPYRGKNDGKKNENEERILRRKMEKGKEIRETGSYNRKIKKRRGVPSAKADKRGRDGTENMVRRVQGRQER